jgi:hypothetical protein
MEYYIKQNDIGQWVLVGEVQSTGQRTCEVYCNNTEDLVNAFLMITGSDPIILEQD